MIKISPSQITLWRTCKRKFAFNYFTKLPKQPETKALAIGNATHARMELYFKSGTPDYSYVPGDAISYASSRILTAIVPFLPQPAEAVSEGTFVTHHDGITFSGRLDWRVPGVEIGDLKTTGNMKYRKTEEELRKDPQALLYSLAFPGLRCRWLYAPTSGGKPDPIVFHADMAHLDPLMKDAQDIADAWVNRPEPTTLDANTDSCYLYNTACPYLAHCGAKPPLFGPKAPGAPDMSMAEFLKNIKPATAPAPTPAAPPLPTPTPTPTPAPAPPEGEAVMAEVTDGVAQDALAAIDTPAPKAKRQRRLAPPEALQAAPAPTPPAEAAVTPTTIPSPANKPIGILLIDCFPRGLGGFVDFAVDILPQARAMVLAEKPEVAEYRFIPFRGAAGAIALAVGKVLEGLPLGTNVTIDSRMDESRDVLAVLEAAASSVVRGY